MGCMSVFSVLVVALLVLVIGGTLSLTLVLPLCYTPTGMCEQVIVLMVGKIRSICLVLDKVLIFGCVCNVVKVDKRQS